MSLTPPQPRQSAQPSQRHLFLQIALFVLAAILIGRSIAFVSYDPRMAADYESWRFAIPYQERCLMVPPLRWSLTGHEAQLP
jgi:hypothetical protein